MLIGIVGIVVYMSRNHSVGEQTERKPELNRAFTANQDMDPFEMQYFYLKIKIMFSNIKMATIDEKQFLNIIYHAGVKTLLIVGYSKLGKNTKTFITKSRFQHHTGKCIRRFAGIYAYCRYFIDRM